MESKITATGLELLIDQALYSEDVVFKCFYWYSGTFNVEIEQSLPSQIRVIVKPKKEQAFEPEILLEQISKDLIDFKLRDIVTKETTTIRELIIAKAFAYADFEQNPTTEVSDPVGFDPTLIQ